MTWAVGLALAVAVAIMLLPGAAPARLGALVRGGRLYRPASPTPSVTDPAGGAGRIGARAIAAGSVVVCLALAAAVGPAVGVEAGVVLAVSAVLGRDLRRGRAEAARLAGIRAAVSLVEGELQAGTPPAAALVAGAALSPHLARALAGAGDAAGALVGCDDRDLRRLGVTWQVGAATGMPLADVLATLGADLRSATEQRRAVSVAVAGPQASAALLCLLPVLGIGLGTAMGARPLALLFGSPAGQALMCGGLLLDAAGVLWVRRILRGAQHPHRPGPARARPAVNGAVVRTALLVGGTLVAGVGLLGVVHGLVAAAVVAPASVAAVRVLERRARAVPPDRSLALALDLAAAALRGGRPVGDALTQAAPAADPATEAALLRVAGLLRLGAQPGSAWEIVRDGPLAHLASVAVRSAASGVRLAAAFERAASEIRAECARSASARAQRAGIAAMGPLAACFLPSFVCLGVVPVVMGIARSALGVLP